MLKTEDVLDLRTAPTIDRLVVVAHDAQIAVRANQLGDDAKLQLVGVLVLIDLHVFEPLLLALEDVGALLEELQRE